HYRQPYVLPSGKVMIVTVQQIVSAPFMQEAISILTFTLQRSLWVGFIGWLFSAAGVLIWLKRRGEAYTTNKPIKGDQLSDAKVVKKLIRSKKLISDLVFGKEQLPLPRSSELQHVLVHGTTGTGKSTVIKELLDHIRRRGERAIVYDKSCCLVSQFY